MKTKDQELDDWLWSSYSEWSRTSDHSKLICYHKNRVDPVLNWREYQKIWNISWNTLYDKEKKLQKI